MKPCFRILGQGAQGITYLTPENIVVKVEPTRSNIIKPGDKFGLEVVPKIPKEVRKHFTQYYSVEFYEENPLLNLKCSKDSIFRFFKKSSFEKVQFPKTSYYKVTTMEYSGDKVANDVVTNAKMFRMMFEQLYVPICAMNYMGYCHGDLHYDNIMFDGTTFKIIDYGLMKEINNDVNVIDMDRFLYNLFDYRTEYRLRSKYPLFWDFDREECLSRVLPEVPEKYKTISYTYKNLIHLEDKEKCSYINDDLKVEFINKDIIYDDQTLLELALLIEEEKDPKKLAIQIERILRVYSPRA